MKIMKAAITAALGISMASAPVLAQTAAPLSLTSRAGAGMQGANQIDDYDGYLLPAVVLLLVMIGVITLAGGGGDNDFDNPVSP